MSDREFWIIMHLPEFLFVMWLRRATPEKRVALIAKMLEVMNRVFEQAAAAAYEAGRQMAALFASEAQK